MKRTRIIGRFLAAAAAILAVTVTVVCLRTTPDMSAGKETYEAATLTTDAYGVVAFQIDLNTAGQPELMRLPGMTLRIAKNILAYRDYYGRFTDVREIGNAEGVTEALCDQWVPYLTLGENGTESSR